MFTIESRIALYNELRICDSRWTTQYEYIWSLIQIWFVDQQSWSTHHLIPIHTGAGLSLSLHRNLIARHR